MESLFLIQVQDSGPDIKADHFDKIFKSGFTTKEDGNRLGLYSAKKEIEASKGEIRFLRTSKTSVEFQLPIAEVPSYFVSEINLANIKRVIVLDGDESIHRVWKKRFAATNIELEHFYKASVLLTKYVEIPSGCILLSDYELLGENLNRQLI